MNYSFAAGIVFFNPTEREVSNAIEYCSSFDKVIIYDNSKECLKIDWIKYPKIDYYWAGSNDGLCKSINYMIDLCKRECIDFLCTLDQDSVFSRENICGLKDVVYNYLDSDVAVIVPRIQYLNISNSKHGNGVERISWAITSGQLLRIELLSRSNIKYDERYFIDRCDKDFCDQVINSGFAIIRNNESVLIQELGEPRNNGHYEHSIMRHYYSFRNRFYYNKKHHDVVKASILNVLQTTKEIMEILAYESNKLKKISQLKYAINDFKEMRMGRNDRLTSQL
jgi:rhamnosyltransferase